MKSMTFRRTGIFLSVVIFVLTAYSLNLIAQEGSEQITLSVSPPSFELSANPGETLRNQIRLENPSAENVEITVEVQNFTALGEEGDVDLTNEDTNYSLAEWVNVSPTKVTIPAEGRQTFDFTVDVPAQAEPGGHFGSILFRTTPGEVDGSGAAVSQRIGSLLLVKVAGDINEDANITDFYAAKHNSQQSEDTNTSFFETGPVELVSRFENTGNVHFKPRGTITITNLFGQETETLNLEERNVLPGAIRKIDTTWSPEFAFGRYTATLAAVYGTQNATANATITFYVIPYKLVLVVLLSIFIVGYLLYKYRERFSAAGKALIGKK